MNVLVGALPSRIEIRCKHPVSANRPWTHHSDKSPLWGLVSYANIRLLSCSTRQNEVERSGSTALSWT
jgi:hypothetical protein